MAVSSLAQAQVTGSRTTAGTPRVSLRWLWLLLLGGCIVLLTACDPTPEQTFVVNSVDDWVDLSPGDGVCMANNGVCTLRAAVQEANAGTTSAQIELSAERYVLAIPGVDEDDGATGDLDLVVPSTWISIKGNGATVDAAGLDRAIHVGDDTDARLDNLTITGGDVTDDGGAILTEGGTHLKGVTIEDNVATAGGAVSNHGLLNVHESLLVDNTATNGGAIDNQSVAVVRNSTLSTNTASGTGGGLHNGPTGRALLESVTVVDNTAGDGAGIASVSPDGSNEVRLANTIVADNRRAMAPAGLSNCRGATSGGDLPTVTSSGTNVTDDSSCNLTGPNDQPKTDPLLQPLADNGGPTRTHSLAAGSPAIDTGRRPTGPLFPEIPQYPTCPDNDQRGFARPLDGDGDGTPACDTGAVESSPTGPFDFVVDVAHDGIDASLGDGICADSAGECTLRAAVQEANRIDGPDRITIAPGINPSLTIPGVDRDSPALDPADTAVGDLDVFGVLTITGNGATIEANSIDRVFAFRGAGTTARVTDLTLTGGSAVRFGGAIYAEPDTQVLLWNMNITGNSAYSGGGIHADGVLSLNDSTLSSNQAGVGGGLSVTGTSTADIYNSTVSGNWASSGGGIFHPDNTIGVTSSTVTANTGGGLTSFNVAADLSNSIVADQTSGPDCYEAATSGGYNVDSDGTCLTAPATGDTTAADALLAPLSDYGGPTPTHLPTPTSAAVDRGSPSCPSTDQRGESRPEDGNNDGVSSCDSGAVEAGPVTALDLTVDTAADILDSAPGDGLCRAPDGSCTLRAAVQETNAHPSNNTLTHTIRIANGIDPVLSIPGTDFDRTPNSADTARGDLDIFQSLIIEGGGATVDAGGHDRAFSVRTPSFVLTADLRDLTITGGVSNRSGGAILVVSGTSLTGRGLTVSGNVAGSGFSGGGIASPGSLRLHDSTITGNTANQGGGVSASGNFVVEIDSTTISGNTGGGVEHGGSSVSVTNSTITDNTGGGINSANTRRLANTVVADQATGADCTGTTLSQGHNVISDGTCLGTPQASDRGNVGDALLAPLADNGGPTLTHHPLPNSPVIDTGYENCPVVDQRGVARPLDGDGSGVANCDTGSVEAPTAPPLDFVVDSSGDTTDGLPGDGICATADGFCTLRAAIQESNARGTDDTITIAEGVNPVLTSAAGAGAESAHGDLDITDSVFIDGGGATISTAPGWASRVIEVAPTAGDIEIVDVTVTGGDAGAGFGGGVLNQATLILRRVTLTDNSAGSGGGVRNSGGVLDIHQSAIVNNTAVSDLGGGGIYNTLAGTLSASHVTVSDNTATHASSVGGGIRSTGAASLQYLTVADNTSGGVGKAMHLTGTNTITSSIAAATGTACGGSISSAGHNLSTDASCSFTSTGDQQSADPALAALAANGGPTPTRMPAAASAAVDVIAPGTNGCGEVTIIDQRGAVRPYGPGCDVGAVERGDEPSIDGLPATLYTTSGPSLLVVTPAGGTLTGPGVGADTFDPAIAGPGTHTILYTLTDGRVTSTVTTVVESLIIGPDAVAGTDSPAAYTAPVGTVLSGPGFTPESSPNQGRFDPTSTGPGTVTLTATGPMCPGGSECSITKDVAVVGFTGATFGVGGDVGPLPSLVASSGPSFNLNALPAGGTFSGPGVTGSRFDPEGAGAAGIKTISYTNNGVTVTRQIEVFAVTLTWEIVGASGRLPNIRYDYEFTGSPAGGIYNPGRLVSYLSGRCPANPVTVTYSGSHRGVNFSKTVTVPGTGNPGPCPK